MSDDGFTDPTPADVDDDEMDVPDPDEQGQVDLSGDVRVIDESVSCENCIHKRTCMVFQGVSNQLQEQYQRADEETPVDPTDLAAVCEEYEADDD